MDRAGGDSERRAILQVTRGQVHFWLGRTADAKADLEEGLEVLERLPHVQQILAYDWRPAAGSEDENHDIGIWARFLATAKALRAQLHLDSGERAEAEVEFRIAARLDPEEPVYTESLALVLFDLGRFSEASEGFKKLGELRPLDRYWPLWVSIAESRSAGRHWLHPGLQTSRADDSWPSPVLSFYRGELSEAEVFAAAKSPSDQPADEKACEAYFYVGQHHIVSGKPDLGADYMRRATSSCPPRFIETERARIELERISLSRPPR
jgi:lipoprotein NlpI